MNSGMGMYHALVSNICECSECEHPGVPNSGSKYENCTYMDIELEKVPAHYKRGLIVPIPKPGKDSSSKDNNRGITLLTVIYKLFDSCYIIIIPGRLKPG